MVYIIPITHRQTMYRVIFLKVVAIHSFKKSIFVILKTFFFLKFNHNINILSVFFIEHYIFYNFNKNRNLIIPIMIHI